MASIRLLQHKSDGCLVFREPIPIDDAPAYAILSHTWGEEEILFDDIESTTDMGKTLGKAGWEKIRFCANQAAADGLQYFWVDTCCIDKKNSTELNAAINSMFRWYQDAARCYVYLADVSSPGPGGDKASTWKAQFEASRWFTRGWTLQELIAPPIVKFFSKEGNALGSKFSLEHDIHEITRIPIRMLRRGRLSEFSVEQRMSWAAKRETSIGEDQIYCLLGVFEVFIPLLYGEGKAHARLRLQEAINKVSEQQWSADLPVLPGLPSSNSHAKRHALSDSMRSSRYGNRRSLVSVNPVLDLPTREFEALLGKLSDAQHEQIANAVAANCRRASYQFYDENSLHRIKFSPNDPLDDAKLFQLPNGKFPRRPYDLDLRTWIRKIQRATTFASLGGSEHGNIQASEKDPPQDAYPFKDALNILKMKEPWGGLSPLEFETSLCYAISWCRHLQAVGCEARLAWLWATLHPPPFVVDDSWALNLDLGKARVKSGIDDDAN